MKFKKKGQVMNFVFLSPQFPPNFFNFCVNLKNNGANVLTISDGPYNEFRQELKNAITENYFVDSLTDYDAIVKAMGYFTHRYGKIDRIESHNEFWLDQEAWLREDFNIFGQRPKDLDFNRSKIGMKTKFEQAKVPAAKAIRITSNEKVKQFVEEHGFPLIIKPDIGVGAQHTFKIKSYEQLNENLANMPSGMILEKFIEGKIVTYDGLTNIHGDVMFASSMELSDSIMDVVNNRGPVHYIYQKDLNPELEKFGQRLVKAFNVKERFFHFEFFRTPEGEHMALEVNIRPPGGYCMDMLNYMCDIDLYKDWADLIVNDEQYLTFERKFNVACVARRDRFNYTHTHDKIISKFKRQIPLHLKMPNVFRTAMGDYIYIIRHPDKKFLNKAINYIEEQV
jgi:hypothetical protein